MILEIKGDGVDPKQTGWMFFRCFQRMLCRRTGIDMIIPIKQDWMWDRSFYRKAAWRYV